MTDQQRLDAANAKYDAAKANPNPGNLSVAHGELMELLFRLRKDVVVRKNGNG